MVTREQVEETRKRIDLAISTELKEYNSVKHWKEFSLTEGQSEEDIRFFAVLGACGKKFVDRGKEVLCDPICYTYISEHQNLTDDLVEELMFLSSGIFGWEYYDAESIKIVADIISVYNYKTKNLDEQKDRIRYWIRSGEIKNQAFEDKLEEILCGKSPIVDRIDWYNLSKNRRLLSDNFIRKYMNLFEIYRPSAAVSTD